MSRPFRDKDNSFLRLFPSEVKNMPSCELNGGSGNALHQALLGVKYRNCDASVRSMVVVPDI